MLICVTPSLNKSLNFSSLIQYTQTDAGVAQVVEQRFCNPQAPRSNRGAGTMEIKR
jgi:hypothetical protein